MASGDDRPLVALTMGDVAGVGPEVIARAWGDSPLRSLARPFVVGSRSVLERALACVGGPRERRADRAARGRPAELAGGPLPRGDRGRRGEHPPRAGRSPRGARGVRLPGHGDRPGAGRPDRRPDHAPAAQGGAARGGDRPPGPHGDPGRAVRRGRPRDDALRRPSRRDRTTRGSASCTSRCTWRCGGRST